MNPNPVNYPGWRRNANLFEGYIGPNNMIGPRQSMRLIVQRQEPARRLGADNWSRVTPNYSDARSAWGFMPLTLRASSAEQVLGAEGLLWWWQYWALRRIRSTVSQFVRRRVPRVAERYRATTWRERLTGPTELFRVSNYVPGAANTVAGRKRSFSTMLDA